MKNNLKLTRYMQAVKTWEEIVEIQGETSTWILR